MNILFINTTGGTASHGRIAFEQAKKYEAEGHNCRIAYGREPAVDLKFKEFGYQIGSSRDVNLHGLKTRLLDAHGFGSKKATRAFLKWADTFDPDLLWLHNIHGYYINVEMLFEWIKSRPNMEVKWTLHDCWAFTGHCTNFNACGCEKWKTHCNHCVQKKEYPGSILLDQSRSNYSRKRQAFTGVKNMTLITPSVWLKDLIKDSFLREYPVEVKYNTINTEIFKPTASNFREEHHLEEKIILLAVANAWQSCKGLDDLMQLHGMLDDSYAIVIVGLREDQTRQLSNSNCQKKYKEMEIIHGGGYSEIVRTQGGIAIPPYVEILYQAVTGKCYQNSRPDNCAQLLLLPKTSSAEALAAIYTAADIFVNPTHEDNYPTVNLEAQACGTWVITYDTCGAKETLH